MAGVELACTLADKAIDVAYLTVAAFLLAQPLDAWLETWPLLAARWTLRLVALFLVVMAIHIAVSFPLSFYSGHLLERRFKLSTQTFGRWLWRYAKRILLAVAFSLAMMLGLYWLIWTTGAWWWLAGGGGVLRRHHRAGPTCPRADPAAVLPDRETRRPELSDRIARLAEGTGLSIEGVYRMGLSAETVKANAMLAGLGRTRRVLLGDTLLSGFQPEEIEVIFAHEIGHHVFHHIRKMILAGLIYSAAGFWLCDRLLAAWAARGGSGGLCPAAGDTLPLVLLILTVFAMLMEPLQNAVSRRFERQCDRYALERTGLKEAYLSAFRKLARLNKDDPNPHWLEVFLFHSHPPVGERLAMAEEVAGRE